MLRRLKECQDLELTEDQRAWVRTWVNSHEDWNHCRSEVSCAIVEFLANLQQKTTYPEKVGTDVSYPDKLPDMP